jgi:hypothetical protein
MKTKIIILAFIALIFWTKDILGQRKQEINKIGIKREFIGVMDNEGFYDGDHGFSFIDDKSGEFILFVVGASSCNIDKYRIDCEVSDDISDRLMHGVKVRVKVWAISAYAEFCSNEPSGPDIEIVWRPLKIIELK